MDMPFVGDVFVADKIFANDSSFVVSNLFVVSNSFAATRYAKDRVAVDM